MTTAIRDCVEAIWADMGHVPPPGPIGIEYEFEVDECAIRLTLSPDGASVICTADLGALASEPGQAADQLRRLLRLGLGLLMHNRAALRLPEGANSDLVTAWARNRSGGGHPLIVQVQASVPVQTPRAAIAAMGDLMQWADLSRALLQRAAPTGVDHGAVRHSPYEQSDFVVFQP